MFAEVCKVWRTVAIGMPRLWNTIGIDYGSASKHVRNAFDLRYGSLRAGSSATPTCFPLPMGSMPLGAKSVDHAMLTVPSMVSAHSRGPMAADSQEVALDMALLFPHPVPARAGGRLLRLAAPPDLLGCAGNFKFPKAA